MYEVAVFFRSSYGNAPGGSVCLQAGMLRAMRDYAVQFYRDNSKAIQINSIAGDWKCYFATLSANAGKH